MADMGKCFRWRLEMLSIPVAGEFLRSRIAFWVSVDSMGFVKVWGMLVFLNFLIIFLFWEWVGMWLCDAKWVASLFTCCLGDRGSWVVGFTRASFEGGGLFLALCKVFMVFHMRLLFVF